MLLLLPGARLGWNRNDIGDASISSHSCQPGSSWTGEQYEEEHTLLVATLLNSSYESEDSLRRIKTSGATAVYAQSLPLVERWLGEGRSGEWEQTPE